MLMFPLKRASVLASLILSLSLSASATSVLFLGGGATPSSGADGSVMTFLETRYGAANVSYLNATASSAGDEAGFDVLIISSTVGSSSVRGKFHDSTVGVLNWESEITDHGQAGEFGVTTRLNEAEVDHSIRITSAHEITAGYAVGQVVQIVDGSDSVFWSVLPEAAGVLHLAEDDDTAANKFISTVDQGELLMGGGVAPGRRVMFGLKDNTFGRLTADGEVLFGKAVDWAAADAAPPGAPVVVNAAASMVEASSATMGGEVTDAGGVAPRVTLYWGDHDGGTAPGNWDASIDFGVQAGAFSGGVSGLIPGTIYYFRSFASNGGGDGWASSTASFTTGVPPTPPGVVNLPALGVSYSTAEVRGEVTATGGESPIVTIYFGDNDGGTVAGNWDDAVALGAHSGVFSNSLFALTAGTTYYFRAFAENAGGGVWAPSSQSFVTTPFSAPEVVSNPATSVTATAAQLEGSVTATGGEAPTILYYWGESDGGADPLAWDHRHDLGQQIAEFSAVISGLTPSTTYFARAFAQNGGGGRWSPATVQFATSEAGVFVISEFMAANNGGNSNNANSWWPIAGQLAGTTHDWIEIHNTELGALDLGGWHLTDRAGTPNQWTFPLGTVVEGGGYLVVYASGNNARDANGNLHTDFSLSSNGEYLALFSPTGGLTSEFGPGGGFYPSQSNDVSYGVHPTSGASVFFTSPTPGSANHSGGVARVADTKFSPDRGYYASPPTVTIKCATPEARIYYTTDGTPPLAADGSAAARAQLYSGPIQVRRTTPIRAAAIKAGFASSDIDTHTYFLLDIQNAASNGEDPAGLNSVLLRQRQPRGWGNLTAGDYNMDPSVSNSTTASSGHGRQTVAQALVQGMRDIPTVAVSMNREDFSGGNGIYSNSGSKGFAWERACSAEFIPAEGDWRKDWGENCGIRVQGGASRSPSASPKHSLSFRFRAEYGVGKLRADLFEDSPVNSFNVIALRAGYNNSWIHRDGGQRSRASMIRDQWARESIYDMGHTDAGRGFMVHLFINGLYWGVHNLCERQDAAHFAAHNGGDEDIIEARNGSEVIDGGSTAWNAMKSVVSSRNWGRIQQVLDIDTFIDYQIVNRYGANHDLKTSGNWRAAGGGAFRRPEEMLPWKLYSWDAERIMESPTATNEPLDPMGIRGTLDNLPEYRIRFADRIQKHFFNGGALTPEASKERWMQFATPLDRAILAESARWGDHRRSPAYSRGNEWLAEQRRLCDSYFPVRSRNVLGRYRSQGFLPDVDAPSFRMGNDPLHGGVIPSGEDLRVTADGTIYYTLDGSDPRLEGGAINPAAQSVSSGSVIPLPASGLVRARARDGATWSALDEATFYLEPLATPADLLVTEVNYHPLPATIHEKLAGAALPVDLNNADLFEFVEIQNVSNHDVNLAGARFTDGIEYLFGSSVLRAGGHLVVVKDAEAFALRYPGVANVGVFSGNLNNDGEQVRLFAAGGDLIQEFTYNDVGDWPSRADGVGSSLEVSDPAGDFNLAASWRASSDYHGSPGAEGSGPDGRIVINEVLSHSVLPAVDMIELHNTTGAEIEISGWFLADSSRVIRSFVVDGNTTIGGDGYLVFDESEFNVRQINAITNYAGASGSSPTTVTTAAPHGLATGDLITISGYAGIGFYNGSHEVQVLSPTVLAIDAPMLDNHADKGSWTPRRPFALNSAHGDEVWLVESDGAGNPIRFVDQVSFQAAFEGETLGRWPNGAGRSTLVSMLSPTMNLVNDGPQVGPVVISELMYQPTGDNAGLEFVEICNTGTRTEQLDHWQLRGGADFDFGPGHELNPGGVLVVVSFDPATDQLALNSFRTAYGVGAEVVLVGPFRDGPLRNDIGSLRLARADLPPPGEPNFYPAVTEDVIDYASAAPWPSGAAGTGDSLTRIALSGFGSFPSSWEGASATPGRRTLGEGYEDWRLVHFGPGAPAGSGPLDDFELDGVLNLFEYAFDLNPKTADGGLPIEIEEEGGELILRYPRNTLRDGLVFRVEKSGDLISWEALADEVESANGSLEQRVAKISTNEAEVLFLRLLVEQR